MFGQFPEWFVPGDGFVVVEEPFEPLEELLEDWAVDVGAVDVGAVDVEPPLAALAIAAPPPMTAPVRASVTRAS